MRKKTQIISYILLGIVLLSCEPIIVNAIQGEIDILAPRIYFQWPKKNNYPFAGKNCITVSVFDSSGVFKVWCLVDNRQEIPLYSKSGSSYCFAPFNTKNFNDGQHKITVFALDDSDPKRNLGKRSINIQIKNHEKVRPKIWCETPNDGDIIPLNKKFWVIFWAYDNVRLNTGKIYLYNNKWEIVALTKEYKYVTAYSFVKAPIAGSFFKIKSPGRYIIRCIVTDYSGNVASYTILVYGGNII